MTNKTSVSRKMAMLMLVILMASFLLISLSACSLLMDHDVWFHVDGKSVKSVTVRGGTKLCDLEKYAKEIEQDYLLNKNKRITGWYYGIDDFTRPLSFDKTVIKDYSFSLCAKYVIDESNHSDLEYQYASGNGTATDPYIVSTPDDLDAMRYGSNLYHKLANNIDLSEYNNYNSSSVIAQWKPIATYDGHFDGNGHTISGFSFYNLNGELCFINKNLGEIKNLKLSYSMVCSVGSESRMSFICATNKGKISNCVVQGVASFANFRAVSCVNANDAEGIIEDCSVDFNITATGAYGYYNYLTLGVNNNDGKIKRCEFVGTIMATDRPNCAVRVIAGAAITNSASGLIDQCKCEATFEAATDRATLGSPAARTSGISATNAGTISNSYFKGSLSASGGYSYAAGITCSSSGFLKYVYVDAQISASNKAALFLAKDSNEAQAVRSIEVIYSNSCNVSNYTYGNSLKVANLNDSSVFSSWDRTIWSISSGRAPLLLCFE